MKEQRDKEKFNEYLAEARSIQKEYHNKIEIIRKQKTEQGLLNGRASFPEEKILMKECSDKIKELADKYNGFNC